MSETPKNAKGLHALGSTATKYEYGLNGPPNPGVLEKFVSPAFERLGHAPGGMVVNIEAKYFTSLCPKTGQPDHATMIISYVPREWCVESKSLKLYLMEFRMWGEFHEACVDRIAQDLISLLDPLALMVEGQFVHRGDIKFWPKVQYTPQSKVIT